MSYRLDNRTEKEFSAFIKKCSIDEARMAIRLAIFVRNNTKKWPDLVPNGIDFKGNFIKDDSKVRAYADFMIDNREIEITHSAIVCNKHFHWKCNKIANCIKNNVDIIFVNGFGKLQEPNFIWLDKDNIVKYTELAKKKYGSVLHPGQKGITNKEAYRYDISFFDNMWYKLPVDTDIQLPTSYAKVIDFINNN